MYPNNPQIIPTHIEIQLNLDSESGSNLPTYIYICTLQDKEVLLLA